MSDAPQDTTLTIEERLDAYKDSLIATGVVNDSMTFSEQVRVMGDAIYQWLVDNNIRVEFHGPRKSIP
jgi:hypothetical protein